MAQYCRYCAHLVVVDGAYCEKLKKFFSYEHCKYTNKCKFFELNPMDAFFENVKGYKPRIVKEKPKIIIETNLFGNERSST